MSTAVLSTIYVIKDFIKSRFPSRTEKDSQEGLKMESSRQKETGKAKNDPEKYI